MKLRKINRRNDLSVDSVGREAADDHPAAQVLAIEQRATSRRYRSNASPELVIGFSLILSARATNLSGEIRFHAPHSRQHNNHCASPIAT